MTLRVDELSSGLTTAMLSKSIREECERVHTDFLKRHSLKLWLLAVTGLQDRAPSVEATSNAQVGADGATKKITLTLSFGEDLMSFLEEQYALWLARRGGV